MVKAKDLKQSIKTITLQGEEFKIAFDLNAFDYLEQAFGNINEAFESMQGGSISSIKLLLWAGINAGFDEDDSYLSQKEVGRLINPAELGEVVEVMTELFENSMPVEEAKVTKGKKKTPSKK